MSRRCTAVSECPELCCTSNNTQQLSLAQEHPETEVYSSYLIASDKFFFHEFVWTFLAPIKSCFKVFKAELDLA